ncbi:MAG TPA: endonuclease/exonuclease/phosphatase family protein [Gaiellaceae bacterium]
MLVRTWNLFHGNTVPPGRTAYLEEMVRLAAADRPDVLLLQELPLWALPEVSGWAGMTAFPEVASRAPLGASLGGTLTALNPGLLRSAVSGQGNAILLDRSLEPFDYHALVLNPRRVRRDAARKLSLAAVARLAWAKERRVSQTIRAEAPDGRKVVITNLHATSYPPDRRVADVELRRAAEFVAALARPGEIEVIGGDFNVLPGSVVIAGLREQGFSSPGAGVDHVLVRGAASSAPERWPDERRRLDGMLVSDHAPLEVRVA